MFRQICFVALLLYVKYCKGDISCTTANAGDKCQAPLYKPGECPSQKCLCADGLTLNQPMDACDLNKPTIKEDNVGKKYYTNEDYKLECTTSAKGVSFKWYKEDDVIKDATSCTVTIKEATVTAPIKYKCEIYIDQVKATSEQTTVTFVVNGSSGRIFPHIPESTTPSTKVIVIPSILSGKACTTDTECSGSEFSGKCGLTDPKRCVCAANYMPKQETCKNGAAILSTSLLLLIVAIFSQLIKPF